MSQQTDSQDIARFINNCTLSNNLFSLSPFDPEKTETESLSELETITSIDTLLRQIDAVDTKSSKNSQNKIRDLKHNPLIKLGKLQ